MLHFVPFRTHGRQQKTTPPQIARAQKRLQKKKKKSSETSNKNIREKVLAADSCCTEALQRQRWAPAYTCFGSWKGIDTSSIMPE